MDSCTNDERFVSAINELFNEKIPFNRVLGLKVESISYERVRVSFQMRNELMGHYKRGMLHGGAISSVIDVTGGLAAFMGVQQKIPSEILETRLERFGRVSTIDLRVDFLRPGIGRWFVATAYTLRTGNKVAVTRIELNNDQDDLIAVGTGSYIVA
ncbi:MAG: thioesterase family protein [Syntrophorhabdaceae bacterium]|nr:thioesterase family protein [Syntrophorhabdaceae bacterium]MDD5245504.1 thioesterase family protein [Syntrophorhabdaceae bacterium]